jgi:hypothetical protein
VAEAFELVTEAMLLAAAARGWSTASRFANRGAAGWFAARTATMVTAQEMERLSVATSSNNQTNNENDATDHGQLLKMEA